MIDKAALTDIILNKEGYVIIDDVLDSKFISRARKELELAISKEAEYHGGDDYSDYGMVLLCALYGGVFIELFDIEGVTTPINNILGDGSIVYAYTSSSMLPNGKNYSNRIHVDCPRLIPGYSTNLGVIIPLDDFTEKNGATFILPGSQNMLESPEEDYFYKNAKRIIAKAGSVIFLNSRLYQINI